MAKNTASQDSPYADLVAVLAGEHGLTYREEYILRLRFALGMTKRHYTRGDIGFLLGVTRERVRQLERQALAKVGLDDLHAPVAKGLPVEELWAQPAAELPPEAEAQHNIFHGRIVRALLAARGDIELTFIQHRDSGVVHVISPTDHDLTPDIRANLGLLGPDFDTPRGRGALLAAFANFLIGACLTLCGYRARRHAGGFEEGDTLVHEFDDDLLCRACVRELGPHSARAFEHPQPKPSEDPNDLGDQSDDPATTSATERRVL